MVIILRHDVDNPYSNRLLLYAKIGWLKVDDTNHRYRFVRSRKMRAARRLSRLLDPVGRKIHISSLGYLGPTRRLLEYEHSLGISSSWFFRSFAGMAHPCPTHEVGYHADFIRDLNLFRRGLYGLPGRAFGFSKHGHCGLPTPSGSGGEGEEYDPTERLYVSRASEFGLKYFSGNKPFHEDGQFFYKEGDVTVFPYMFSVQKGYMSHKYTIDWLVDHCASADMVLSIHPGDCILLPKTTELVYSKCKNYFTSFRRFLEVMD